MRISIFGDSIMEGVRLENGKYKRDTGLIQRFEIENGVQIINKSRFGSTIVRGAKSLQNNVEKGELGEYTIIEFGGNDCDHNWEEVAGSPDAVHLCATPDDEFQRQYRHMIELIRSSGSIPVAATLPPISAERYLSWICRRGLDRKSILKWLGDVQVIFKRQALFSSLSESTAKNMDCLTLDLRSVFPKEQTSIDKYLCDDGIHPNLDGQKLIYNEFSRFISSLKAAKSA